MKIKEFLKNTKKKLGVQSSDIDESNKKKRLQSLLEKLEVNIKNIKNKLNNEALSSEQKSELEEELHVYKLQIKKGREILDKKS